jgi:hypothetical protein
MTIVALVLAAAVVAAIVVWRLAPKRYVVHAARAKELSCAPMGKWLLAGLARDEEGHAIPMADKFVGCADGNSMVRFGIRDGASFIADKLSDQEKRDLSHRDIVVVHGPAVASTSGYRLRVVDRVDDGKVVFMPDENDKPHRDRPLSEVIAKVAYVV